MKLHYTRHQVARGSRPDAEIGDKLYLLKKVFVLHATYQVRLLAYRAQQEGRRLVIRVPRGFKPGPSLKALMDEIPGVIRIERSES
jgi:hypothetical protein